jgi:acetyl-CoA synthetase
VHVHKAVVNHASTGRYALELQARHVYWCTADPGWVTGTSYGIIAPLVHRVTMIVDEAEFDLERWYATLEREKVEVWYTAPTAIRMMMRAGKDAPGLRFLGAAVHRQRRRAAQSRGRGLGQRGLRAAVPRQLVADRNRRHHDRQHADMDIKPGSMGKPLPGIEAASSNRTTDDGVTDRASRARSANWRCGPAGRR